MLIIVEGSNKVGKSTMISKLVKMHNVHSVYNRGIMDLMVDKEKESVISAMAMLSVVNSIGGQNVIFDRFHLSEYIYGVRNRGYENKAMFQVVDKELSEMEDVLLIVLTSDYKHIEDIGKEYCHEYYMQIQEEFKEAFYRSRIKHKLMLRLEDVV